jgi:hypothetical protein
MRSKIRSKHALILAVAGLAIAATLGVGAATSDAASASKRTITQMHVIEREVRSTETSIRASQASARATRS